MAFLSHNGRSVAYRLLGAAANPLVVLSHPLGMTQAVWDDILPLLLPHYRVLTWDLPGHGASDAVGGDQVTPQDLAAEALALVDHAGGGRFHFAGTSIGGVVGQQLIAAHSDRLMSATLTNTGPVIGNAELWNARAERVRTEGLEAIAPDIVARWFAPSTFDAEPALNAGWCTQMGRGDGESYAQLCEMLGRTSFMGQLQAPLSGTKAPKVRLLGGSDDLSTPPATLETLAGELNNAPLDILEGVGHVPSVEVPELFASHLMVVLGRGE